MIAVTFSQVLVICDSQFCVYSWRFY